MTKFADEKVLKQELKTQLPKLTIKVTRNKEAVIGIKTEGIGAGKLLTKYVCKKLGYEIVKPEYLTDKQKQNYDCFIF